jgi:6-pyruvoyl-tetrahydropterin synthase
MYIQYKRTVEFFASHFNETNYSTFESMKKRFTDYQNPISHTFASEGLLTVLKDIHGHNFKAEVELMAEVSEGYSSYIISDEDLVATVKEWEGINLSVHEDFLHSGIRATTENMAQVLCQKIFVSLKAREQAGIISNIVVNTTVHESDDISSTAVRTSNG